VSWFEQSFETVLNEISSEGSNEMLWTSKFEARDGRELPRQGRCPSSPGLGAKGLNIVQKP
jgi:hypothetical protein